MPVSKKLKGIKNGFSSVFYAFSSILQNWNVILL